MAEHQCVFMFLKTFAVPTYMFSVIIQTVYVMIFDTVNLQNLRFKD